MPLPVSLVVKNGSKILSMISFGMPVPVSRHLDRHVVGRAAAACTAAPCIRSAVTFAVRTVSLPPFGIASRAFTARFTTTCSSCDTSAFTGQRSRPCTSSSVDLLAEQAPQQHVEVGQRLAEIEHLRPQASAGARTPADAAPGSRRGWRSA